MDSTSTRDTSSSVDVTMKLRRNSNDIGWNYCTLIDENNKDKVKCLKCHNIYYGGVYRMKEHIGQIKGNVASCLRASKEDQLLCKNAIIQAKQKIQKKKTEEKEKRLEENIQGANSGDDELQECFGHMRPPHTLGPMDKFASQLSPDSLSLGMNKRQQNISDALFKERTKTPNAFICRWVYEARILFNCMMLDSFKLAMEVVGQFGPELVTPTRYGYTVQYLKDEVDRTKDLISKHEKGWKLNGCSIMTDGWSDRKRRSIMNLCVNSSLGTVFLSCKDFSDTSHTSEVIAEYVDQCIAKIGPENVVQIVTDNASNNMGAGRLLKIKRPKIFWTSCAAHTIDLMLESIAKQSTFKKYIDEAKA